MSCSFLKTKEKLEKRPNVILFLVDDLGWYPYFLSSDLYNSSVIFDSKLKLKLDHRNMTEKMMPSDYAEGFKISNKSLVDCFILESNEV